LFFIILCYHLFLIINKANKRAKTSKQREGLDAKEAW